MTPKGPVGPGGRRAPRAAAVPCSALLALAGLSLAGCSGGSSAATGAAPAAAVSSTSDAGRHGGAAASGAARSPSAVPVTGPGRTKGADPGKDPARTTASAPVTGTTRSAVVPPVTATSPAGRPAVAGTQDCGTFRQTDPNRDPISAQGLRCFVDAMTNDRRARMVVTTLTVDRDSTTTTYETVPGKAARLTSVPANGRSGGGVTTVQICTGPRPGAGLLLFAQCVLASPPSGHKGGGGG